MARTTPLTVACTQRFVKMFANADSVRLPGDARAALPVLFAEVAELCGTDPAPPLDVVEGAVPERLMAKG